MAKRPVECLLRIFRPLVRVRQEKRRQDKTRNFCKLHSFTLRPLFHLWRSEETCPVSLVFLPPYQTVPYYHTIIPYHQSYHTINIIPYVIRDAFYEGEGGCPHTSLYAPSAGNHPSERHKELSSLLFPTCTQLAQSAQVHGALLSFIPAHVPYISIPSSEGHRGSHCTQSPFSLPYRQKKILLKQCAILITPLTAHC